MNGRFLATVNFLWWPGTAGLLGYFFGLAVFAAPLYPRGMPKLVLLAMAGVWIIAALAIFIAGRAIYPWFAGLTWKRRLAWGLTAVLIAVFLILVIPFSPRSLSLDSPDLPAQLEWLLYLPDVAWMAFVIWAAGLWLVMRPATVITPPPAPKGSTFLFALPLFVTWSIYLLAYWPAGMSPDSIDQWTQLETFHFIDWHPAFHTLTEWLITRLWLSPAAVALAQIICLSLVIGWGLSTLRDYGAPRWLPWLVIAFLMVAPSTGSMVIMLWKDIPFSIAVLALTIQVLKICFSDGEWLRAPTGWVALGVVAALVTLYRQNGFTAAGGTLVCLLVVYRTYWKQLSLALLLAVGLWLGIRGPFYDLFNVQPSTASGVEMTLADLLSRYTNSDTPILPAERAVLLEVRPDQHWPYTCSLQQALYFDGNFNFTKKLDLDLAVLSSKLIVRNPQVFLDHLSCTGSFVYQITRTPGTLYEASAPYIIRNDLGLVSSSQIPGIKTVLDNWMANSLLFLEWFFWRVPFWNYVLLAGLTVYGLRTGRWQVFTIAVPALANLLPYSLLGISQTFRFVYPTFLVGSILGVFFLFTGAAPARSPQA